MKRNLSSQIVSFALIAVFAATAVSFAGGKIRPKIINLKRCNDQGDCVFSFRTRGVLSKAGEKDYFKFYNPGNTLNWIPR